MLPKELLTSRLCCNREKFESQWERALSSHACDPSREKAHWAPLRVEGRYQSSQVLKATVHIGFLWNRSFYPWKLQPKYCNFHQNLIALAILCAALGPSGDVGCGPLGKGWPLFLDRDCKNSLVKSRVQSPWLINIQSINLITH
jgi:hypothetical protein